ncbi:DUF2076 family protein [Frateuria aurantia]
MKKILCALALCASLSGVALAQADVSPKMVQAAIQTGDYHKAEQELTQVIAQHPDSAKAHYVLAQVLAKEGNLEGARQQLNQASQIDPAIHFTSPERFNSFRAEINQAMGELGGHRSTGSTATGAGYGQSSTVAPRQAEHGHGSGLIIGLIILLAVIALIWRAMARSNQARAAIPPQGYNNANYGYGQPPQPPYGPQGGAGGARSVMGQVASTAAGVAGGMLAADAIEGMLHHGGEANAATPPAFGGNGGNDPLQNIGNSGIDMGNDDSSWGGGDSSSSFDDDNNSW